MERVLTSCVNIKTFFPNTFAETKDILGEQGNMKISLKLGMKPIHQRTYCLNPIYKHKVKEELERMLKSGIIELVKESK